MDFYFCLPLYGQFLTKTSLLMKIFAIIPYHFNAPIMLLRYVICNYIWHMGSQNYELLFMNLDKKYHLIIAHMIKCTLYNFSRNLACLVRVQTFGTFALHLCDFLLYQVTNQAVSLLSYSLTSRRVSIRGVDVNKRTVTTHSCSLL